MQIGVVGLGRMGGNISRRLLKHGHDVVVFDRNPETVAELGKADAKPAKSLDDLTKQLSAPRTVWIMLPSGTPTEGTIAQLSQLLGRDDTIIDGGNTFYKDDIRRADELRDRKLDRAALASLLTEVAVQLSEDGAEGGKPVRSAKIAGQ